MLHDHSVNLAFWKMYAKKPAEWEPDATEPGDAIWVFWAGFNLLAEPGNLIMMKKAEFEAFIAK